MNMSAAFVIVRDVASLLPQVKRAVPKLDFSYHKGSMGRIGGCSEFSLKTVCH